MARNGRGGVRYGLVFAVLFALIAYAIGVSERDSALAVLAASESVTGGGSELHAPGHGLIKCAQVAKSEVQKEKNPYKVQFPPHDKAADMLNTVSKHNTFVNNVVKNGNNKYVIHAVGLRVIPGRNYSSDAVWEYRIRFSLFAFGVFPLNEPPFISEAIVRNNLENHFSTLVSVVNCSARAMGSSRMGSDDWDVIPKCSIVGEVWHDCKPCIPGCSFDPAVVCRNVNVFRCFAGCSCPEGTWVGSGGCWTERRCFSENKLKF